MSDPKTPAYWDPIVDNAMGRGDDWVVRRNVAYAVSMEVEFKVLPAAARTAQVTKLREVAAQLNAAWWDAHRSGDNAVMPGLRAARVMLQAHADAMEAVE